MTKRDTHLDILGGDDGGADGLIAHIAQVVVEVVVALGTEPPLHRDTLPLLERLLSRRSESEKIGDKA